MAFDVGDFIAPFVRVHVKRGLQPLRRKVQTASVQTTCRGSPANRRFYRLAAALNTLAHPDQCAHVFAEAGPQKFADFILAEPVDLEEFGWVGQSGADLDPVMEVIAHVVAAEREHRERVPA